nr:xylulose kinase-1 [Tanacetum cinerariifolium]
MLEDTQAVKTILLDIPYLGKQTSGAASYSKFMSREMSKAKALVKAEELAENVSKIIDTQLADAVDMSSVQGTIVHLVHEIVRKRVLIMPAWVLNYLAFKLEEIVMAMMTCLKSSGIHCQCFTVKCGLLWYLRELLKRRNYRSDLKPFLTNSKEKHNLISLSKMSDHEDETINEENAPPKAVLQITTITNIYAKFSYPKKGDTKSMTTYNDGNLKIRPSVAAEEHQHVQREEKARIILLSALPDEQMGDLYHMIDARDIWNAIKARFSGNAEFKKMQKSLLKQKFKEFKIFKEEGLDKGYDKMQKIPT